MNQKLHRRHKPKLGLTVTEAAKVVGLSYGAIVYNIKKGHLKARAYHKKADLIWHWYIRESDLDEFIRDYYDKY